MSKKCSICGNRKTEIVKDIGGKEWVLCPDCGSTKLYDLQTESEFNLPLMMSYFTLFTTPVALATAIALITRKKQKGGEKPC